MTAFSFWFGWTCGATLFGGDCARNRRSNLTMGRCFAVIAFEDRPTGTNPRQPTFPGSAATVSRAKILRFRKSASSAGNAGKDSENSLPRSACSRVPFPSASTDSRTRSLAPRHQVADHSNTENEVWIEVQVQVQVERVAGGRPSSPGARWPVTCLVDLLVHLRRRPHGSARAATWRDR